MVNPYIYNTNNFIISPFMLIIIILPDNDNFAIKAIVCKVSAADRLQNAIVKIHGCTE